MATPVSRTSRREVHTADMALPDTPDIILPGLDEPLIRENESIATLDSSSRDDYYKELQFMEEMVTIRLEPSSEKNAPSVIDVYVNGRPEWIPVGKPFTLARKYVEVLARAKPIEVQTSHDTPETSMNGDPQNRVVRTIRSKHPFSVINDPNPRGIDWLTRIMQES